MRRRSATFEELQFTSQIPSRLEFLRESSLFAEAFARMAPLVFGPLIIQQWALCSHHKLCGEYFEDDASEELGWAEDGAWSEAAVGWGAVCSAYSAGIAAGTTFGQFVLRRRMRMSQLQTPLLDSHLVRAAKTVAEEAGASFLVVGLVGLALAMIAIGWGRSVPVFAASRAASGFFAGALVARWDPGVMAGGRKPERKGASSPSQDEPSASRTCVQANSSTWLTGCTIGPLLGIFFQQRAFSRWKATLNIPTRVKALPEKMRYLRPALAPCVGAALVLIFLALLVLCETGIRWLKCDRLCQKCRRCRESFLNLNVVDGAVSPRSLSSSSSLTAQDCQPSRISQAPSAALSMLCGLCCCKEERPEERKMRDPEDNFLDDDDSNNTDDEDERFEGPMREERFLTANDDTSDSDESSHEGRGRLSTQELTLEYSRSGTTSKPLSPTSVVPMTEDPRWGDFSKAFGPSKAPIKFQAMLEWRRANNIDSVKETPHPKFFVFKKAYPFFIHGRSKFDELVSYENPGKMNLSEAREQGCSPTALRGILSCIYEFVSMVEAERASERAAEPGSNENVGTQQARTMTVIDVGGLSMGNLNKDTFAFMLTAGDIMDNYYPLRVKRVFIVNAPFWFSGAWRGISALLPATITELVNISGVGQAMPTLLQFIDLAQIPAEYVDDATKKSSGLTFLPLGEHPLEKRLCATVRASNEGSKVVARRGSVAASQSVGSSLADLSTTGPLPKPELVRSQTEATASLAPASGLAPPSKMVRRSNSSPELNTPLPLSGGSAPQEQGPVEPGGSWNPFQRLFKSRSRPIEAHLGEENAFVYNRSKGEWVLESTKTEEVAGEEDHEIMKMESTVVLNEEGHEELLEQHSITLAIQAAHLATEWQRLGHIPGSEVGEVGAQVSQGGAGTAAAVYQGGNQRLLCLLLLLHSSWCLIHLGLETVVPLWMFSPPERGGLGFEPVDAALVFGFVGCALLMLKSFAPRRLAAIPRHSPLRSLRVGVGIMVCLSVIAKWVPAAELHKPRNESVVVWVLVTALLSGMAAAIILGRSATATMLEVAFHGDQLRPDYKKFLENTVMLSETVAPLLAGVAFAFSFKLNRPYPMDATFFFNALAALGVCLYAASLQLRLQITGDFSAEVLPTACLERRCPRTAARLHASCCLEEVLVVPATVLHDVNALLADASIGVSTGTTAEIGTPGSPTGRGQWAGQRQRPRGVGGDASKDR